MSTPPPEDPPTRPEFDEHPVGPSTDDPTSWGPVHEALPPPRPPGPGDGLGTAALVLGIVGVVLAVSVVGGVVLGVLALVFGVLTLRAVRRGEARNRGQALAGTILGAIAVVLAVATAVVVLVAGLSPLRPAAATSAANRPQLTQCVQQAHGDRAAIRQCRRQFGRQPAGATT